MALVVRQLGQGLLHGGLRGACNGQQPELWQQEVQLCWNKAFGVRQLRSSTLHGSLRVACVKRAALGCHASWQFVNGRVVAFGMRQLVPSACQLVALGQCQLARACE